MKIQLGKIYLIFCAILVFFMVGKLIQVNRNAERDKQTKQELKHFYYYDQINTLKEEIKELNSKIKDLREEVEELETKE